MSHRPSGRWFARTSFLSSIIVPVLPASSRIWETSSLPSVVVRIVYSIQSMFSNSLRQYTFTCQSPTIDM